MGNWVAVLPINPQVPVCGSWGANPLFTAEVPKLEAEGDAVFHALSEPGLLRTCAPTGVSPPRLLRCPPNPPGRRKPSICRPKLETWAWEKRNAVCDRLATRPVTAKFCVGSGRPVMVLSGVTGEGVPEVLRALQNAVNEERRGKAA